MKLEKQLEKELKESFKNSLKKIRAFKTVNDVLNWWYYRQLLTKKEIEKAQNNELTLKEVKTLLVDAIKKENEKTYKSNLKKINNILAQKNISWGKCSIEWIKNRTWGNCPKGEYCNGFKYQEYKSVTGYGFCKLSTLTAQMLNDDKNLMSYIYKFVEKHNINKNNIEKKLGYGIRISYGKPIFEGGVGVECHKRILEKLGFKIEHHETRISDIITFDLIKK